MSKSAAAKTAPAKGSAKAPAKTATAKADGKPDAKAAAPSKQPAKPATKPATKPVEKTNGKSVAPSPAKNGADKGPKGLGTPVGNNGKPSGAKVPAKGAEKPAEKPTGKSAAPATPSPKGGKADASVPAKVDAKSGGKTAPKADAKPTGGKNAAGKTDGKAAPAGDGAEATKPDTKSAAKGGGKKKGPIDLSTAKSVAAVAAASQADSSGYVVINGRRVRMISTKGLPAPKRTRVAVEKEVEKTEPPVTTIKTKLNKKELDEYKALLMLKRRQLVGMLHGMEDEALRSSGGNLSTMPLHMADIGTDTFDQDFTLGMAETERALLDEIDAALTRINNRTYGVCQLSGKPIPKSRLEAKPWAKYSIEAAKLMERGSGGR